MENFIHIDLVDVDDRASVTLDQLHELLDRGCIKCGAKTMPEPTAEERARIFADPDYSRPEPIGVFLHSGFGLFGGGYGPYAYCEGCGFLAKHHLGTESEA